MTDYIPSSVEGYHDEPEPASHAEYSAFVLDVKEAADRFPMGYRPPPQWDATTGAATTHRLEVFVNGWHLVAEAFDAPKNCIIYRKRWELLKNIAARHSTGSTR